MQDIHSSNPPVVTGICDPSNSRARHHRTVTLLTILTAKKLLEHFTKKNYKKSRKEFRIEKVIKKKCDKLYVNWKGYNNLYI